jgi:hypothetical protein
LAPFVEQARAKAKAKVKAMLAARDGLSDLDDEVRARPPPVQGSPAPALPASPLQLRPKPKRARKLPKALPALGSRPKRAQKLPKRYC